MKERPILMSGAMVRAILADRKLETRRVVKPQDARAARFVDYGTGFQPESNSGKCGIFSHGPLPYKYGKPGDRLWVKETFQTGEFAQNDPQGAVYRATDSAWETCDGWAWKPSIFMPRALSRITLDVTALRVERLQDITPEGAWAEGCGTDELPWRAGELAEHPWVNTYAELWESINGPGSWAANPWVWVVGFKRTEAA